MKSLFLAVLAGSMLVVSSHASWGIGGCGPVGPAPVAQGYSWLQSGPGQFALMLDGRQIGGLRASDCTYFNLMPDGTWQEATCPTDLPPGVAPVKKCCPAKGCKCGGYCHCTKDKKCCPDCPCGGSEKRVESELPTGVEPDKVEADKHVVNGRSCSKREVMDAIKKATVPSDQNKLRLVLIGSQDATEAILRDLKGIPDAADFLTTAYTPDHWAVRDNGLANGKPFSIVVLTPDGTPLHRQWDYSGGVQALAEALRDAKAGYDPSKDPDLRKRDPIASLTNLLREKLQEVPTEVWVGLAIGAFLLYRAKVKK